MSNEQRAFLLEALKERFPWLRGDGLGLPLSLDFVNDVCDWYNELETESRCICGEMRPCVHVDDPGEDDYTIQHSIGIDGDGDTCAYFQIISPDGEHVRYLEEKEIDERVTFIFKPFTKREQKNLEDGYELDGSCECSTCTTVVDPNEEYFATPCGTFCDSCMSDHAEECEVCASEFGLKSDSDDDEEDDDAPIEVIL